MRIEFIVLGALLFPQMAVHAQSKIVPAQYSIKEDYSGMSLFRRSIATGRIPFDKRYSELTPEQQQILKARYEGMGETDEPPFPLEGLRPIYKALADAQQKLGVWGDLVLFVDVDSQGQPTSASVMQSPDPEMARFAATILMLQRYKAALCKGVPCKMQFPVSVQFKLR